MKLRYFSKLLLLFLACHLSFLLPVYAGEGTEFISKVNNAYYNLRQLGLQEFKCEVNNAVLEQLKDSLNLQFSAEDSRIKALNALRFYLIFDQSGEFRFESPLYSPTGNAQFDLGVRQVVDGTRDMVLGFCDTWRGFIIEPIFEDMNLTYAIEKTYRGYDISYKEEGADVTMSIDNDFRILQALFTLGNSVNKVMPHFIQTNQGLLLTGYDADINNGLMKVNTVIDYQEIEGLQMLKRVATQSIMPGGQQNIELNFSNFSVTRK